MTWAFAPCTVGFMSGSPPAKGRTPKSKKKILVIAVVGIPLIALCLWQPSLGAALSAVGTVLAGGHSLLRD